MTAAVDRPPVPLWDGLEQVPDDGPRVVTLGVFDGVHRGHARLIDRAVRLGRARGMPTVLVTFDPHPASVVGASRDTSALSTLERRAELAAARGVDAVCVLHFTRELAALAPERFVDHVLVEGLHAAGVVVGANFTFGHRAAGDVDTLRQLGEQHGFTVDTVALVHTTDSPCSSTYTRGCLRRGDVRAAAVALGRSHRVDGTLHDGELALAAGTALPAPGRYRARLDGPDEVDTVEVTAEVTEQRRLRLHPGRGRAGSTDQPVASGVPVSVEFLESVDPETRPVPDLDPRER